MSPLGALSPPAILGNRSPSGLLDGSPSRLRVLVVSHVIPFPPVSGQRQRVLLTLRALRERFHVTIVTAASRADSTSLRGELLRYCDDVFLVEAESDAPWLRKLLNRVLGAAYCVWSGEKRSNFLIGRLLFSPRRMASLVSSGRFDFVLYEYWHANASAAAFRARGIPAVLDMHNVLWQSRRSELAERRGLPSWLRTLMVSRYRRREEAAWRRYDALIAINGEELRYTSARVGTNTKVFYAPMGIALDEWPYCWQPADPPRVAYYGGLGSVHNQRSALRCARQIMPHVWREFPNAELWLIGSNPPASLRVIAGSRVTVTGFVEDVKCVLGSASVLLCPWEGTYGFRSRLVEAMSLGIPVVATHDAVHGMEFRDGTEVRLAENDPDLAAHVRALLRHHEDAREQSRRARDRVEKLFSYQATYSRLIDELHEWLGQREARPI